MLFDYNEILVKKVMNKDYIVLNIRNTVNEAIKLMLKNNIQDVFIEDLNHNVKGVITLSDVANIYDEINQEILLKKYIRTNMISVDKNKTLYQCRSIMIENNIGRLPVLEKGNLIGVIRQAEIRDYFYMDLERISKTLNHIVESIHEALCLIDTKGKVIIWNKNAAELYDIPQKDIVGKNIKDFFPDSINSKVLESKERITNVYHSPKKNYKVIINALPIYINGKFEGVLTTDRDVTEVTSLSKKLEKANSNLKFLEGEFKKLKNNYFDNIIGRSTKIIEKIKIAKQVSKSDISVLISGESGTGKELFAKNIHDYSGGKGSFIPVNCSAIPNELFESEFFGYDEGAFTGANKKGKVGFFELANNGTLFLDEIAELPLYMQAKLLRVLQDNTFTRVGGTEVINSKVRIISATNANLAEMVDEGKFRKDLFYRLNVIEIKLPPLRERENDIVLLTYHFLNELAEKNNRDVPKISPEVLDIFKKYNWNGNIRELRNVVEHTLVLCTDNVINKDRLPSHILKFVKEKEHDFIKTESTFDLNKSISNLEKKIIIEALKNTKGNKAKAAKLLNIPRSTLHYKLDSYEIVNF
ncbi:sigma-54 dependent transcriptional regulator PrdR [Senegalia massiliensis]|uniref:CBS domain-containing protein n=1 Tax=Senegalia massiliensis TaxID=1720316 RepID=A0A845QYB7_9CLOT|nr:sigma-54 dependent transcriptional regulator PrdR [Senegalia massiliensis]NBI07160.1 CBS domain-containing protein [Senegalia massiliensis]